jgi:hypothetical protein
LMLSAATVTLRRWSVIVALRVIFGTASTDK